MRIEENQLFKIYLFLAIGFYMNLIGFGSGLFFGGGAGLESSMSGNPINQISGFVLLLIAIVLLIYSNKLSLKKIFLIGWPVWMLIGFFFVSLYWSATPGISFRRVVALTIMALTCAILVVIFKPTYLLNLIATSIVWIVIIGFIYTILTGQGLAFGLNDRESSFRGIFLDKNAAARIYAYGLLLFIGLGRYKTRIDLISLVLLGIAVLLAQSATAIVMVVMGTGLIVLFNMFKGQNIQHNILKFFGLLATLIVATFIIDMAYSYILTSLGRDPTLTDRAVIWSLIDPLISDNFIKGYGYGAFWVSDASETFIARWGFIGNAHSGYREAMLHGGIIAFSLLVLMLVLHISNSVRTYIIPSSDKLPSLLLMMIILMTVINYIGYIILNHNSVDMFLYLLFFFIVSYQVGIRKHSILTGRII